MSGLTEGDWTRLDMQFSGLHKRVDAVQMDLAHWAERVATVVQKVENHTGGGGCFKAVEAVDAGLDRHEKQKHTTIGAVVFWIAVVGTALGSALAAALALLKGAL